MSVADKFALKSSKEQPLPKQMRLNLAHINFWSVAIVSFLVGLSLAIVTVFAALLAWMILNQSGALHQLDQLISSASTVSGGGSTKSVLGLGAVIGFSTMLAAAEIIVITVAGSLLGLIYNMSVKWAGGLFVGFTNP